METGLKNVAIRINNAETQFIGLLMELGGISKEQAESVFDLYRSHKVLKLDAVGGRYSVKHGGLLDRDCIRHHAGV